MPTADDRSWYLYITAKVLQSWNSRYAVHYLARELDSVPIPTLSLS